MRTLDGHGVVVLDEQRFKTVAGKFDPDALAQAHAHLKATAGDPTAVDVAMRNARTEMVWWSARLGFSHDCSNHEPSEASSETCDPEAKQIPMVLGINEALLKPVVPKGRRT